jgi:hypothetical protein
VIGHGGRPDWRRRVSLLAHQEAPPDLTSGDRANANLVKLHLPISANSCPLRIDLNAFGFGCEQNLLKMSGVFPTGVEVFTDRRRTPRLIEYRQSGCWLEIA